jgi:hypothetical protein
LTGIFKEEIDRVISFIGGIEPALARSLRRLYLAIVPTMLITTLLHLVANTIRRHRFIAYPMMDTLYELTGLFVVRQLRSLGGKWRGCELHLLWPSWGF